MKIISWNVRGMNSVDTRVVIKDAIKSARGAFLFFQETKMEVIDEKVVKSLCVFSNVNFAFCPSRGLSRGILLVWHTALWH